ncbi:MAG: hypothetical protein EOO70_05175, partial [Myxococcaceae bacterium]
LATYSGSLVLLNRNTGSRLRATFDPRQSGTEVEVDLAHLEPGGAVTGEVLPSGSVLDRWRLPDGREIEGSLVDVASPVLMLRAADVGVDGTESRQELSSRHDLLADIEVLRTSAAEVCGLIREGAPSRAVPRVSLILPASKDTGADVDTRNVSLQRIHHAIPATSAMCVAAASRIPGTIAQAMATPSWPDRVTIAHPRGVVHLNIAMTQEGSGSPPHVDHVGGTHTTRTLMTGTAFPGETP